MRGRATKNRARDIIAARQAWILGVTATFVESRLVSTILRCNNPMEIDLVILVAKGEALHDQSSVQEIDDLSKQKRHVKSGE
ncbi:hypothetical protein J6590_090971, partial [Homalodisca vitripennis]